MALHVTTWHTVPVQVSLGHFTACLKGAAPWAAMRHHAPAWARAAAACCGWHAVAWHRHAMAWRGMPWYYLILGLCCLRRRNTARYCAALARMLAGWDLEDEA
jgi:hypothetical protein